MKSLGDEYLKYSKHRRRTELSEPVGNNDAFHTQPTSPSAGKHKNFIVVENAYSGETTRRPPLPFTRHPRRVKPL
jgi:hypothetical protein